MRFLTVKGEPNTMGCRRSFAPALALNMDAGVPVAVILAWFWITNSALGARQRTRLPVISWIRRAMSAMTWLFPAAVTASITAGSTLRRIQSTAASEASCW